MDGEVRSGEESLHLITERLRNELGARPPPLAVDGVKSPGREPVDEDRVHETGHPARPAQHALGRGLRDLTAEHAFGDRDDGSAIERLECERRDEAVVGEPGERGRETGIRDGRRDDRRGVRGDRLHDRDRRLVVEQVRVVDDEQRPRSHRVPAARQRRG